MNKFNSILIANRGEIAVRVMRTARELGYRTIAVYSDADADALHVRSADEAVRLGPGPVGQSYLDIDRIIQAARVSGAQAIHPGYGFLSENESFAKACATAGLVFIGPSADAIRLMGSKAEAKRQMLKVDVPCIPGYDGADQSDDAFAKAAESIGFPIMVKATAGGGGRGMRLVTERQGLMDALRSARSEAKSAFGSSELILERAVLRPRHVEIQVFGDTHGNIVHLGERDCSIQRRHQKIVEEAPCPTLTADLRSKMGAAAVLAARTVKYVGAGTVEFLLDEQNRFYFLEMNTRLQVEHPVTEMITGRDLVKLQIEVAQGLPLGFTQDDVALGGHAIEVRLCTEDPAKDFLPVTGKLSVWRPVLNTHVRVDHGVVEGQEISPYYDPMIAKIIAWGDDRESARARLVHALERTSVLGLATNKDYLAWILGHATFKAGAATTAFLTDNAVPEPDATSQSHMAAIAATVLYHHKAEIGRSESLSHNARLMNWFSSVALATKFDFRDQGIAQLAVTPDGLGRYRVSIGESIFQIAVTGGRANELDINVDGKQLHVVYSVLPGDGIHLSVSGATITFHNYSTRASAALSESDGRVRAPMHGKVIGVSVSVGAEVEKGAVMAVLEAMKMEHQILAPIAGKVVEIDAAEGVQIPSGGMLFRIESKDTKQKPSLTGKP